MRTILLAMVLLGMAARGRAADEIGFPITATYLPEAGETYTVSLAFGADALSESNVYPGDGIYFRTGDAGFSEFVAHLTNDTAESFNLMLNGQLRSIADSSLGAPFTGIEITELELGINKFVDRNTIPMTIRGHATPEPGTLTLLLSALALPIRRQRGV